MSSKTQFITRLSRGVAHAVPLAIPLAMTLFLISCSSTGSNLDVAGASLQAGLVAPLPTNPNQAANGLNSAPAVKPTGDQAGTLGFAAGQNQQTVAEASSVEPTPSEVSVVAAPDATSADPNTKLVQQSALAAEKKSNATAPDAAVSETAPAATVATGPQPIQPVIVTAPVDGAPAVAKEATKEVAVAAVEPTPAAAPAATAETKQKSTAAEPQTQVATVAPAAAPAAPAKKKTFFDALFASNKKPKSATEQAEGDAAPAETQLALASTEPAPKKSKPLVEPVLQPVKKEPAKLDLAKLESNPDLASDAPAVDNGELPGVRKGALFEIKRRDSLDSDEDIDIGESDSGPVLLASAGGLARLTPNGLRVQRQSVEVACLKPQLVKILKTIERHYGKQVVVSSGYRSPGYNRRVRGAKNSLHMFCAAADIQVPGVGKWALAKYARSMSGRGGVGTYCHTDSVHIDVGPDRDWNWRCSRRK